MRKLRLDEGKRLFQVHEAHDITGIRNEIETLASEKSTALKEKILSYVFKTNLMLLFFYMKHKS